jgi:hypothetical protein
MAEVPQQSAAHSSAFIYCSTFFHGNVWLTIVIPSRDTDGNEEKFKRAE